MAFRILRDGGGWLLAVVLATVGVAAAGTNYATGVTIDGQKLDGSFLELAAGEGKVLTVKSRKALQLQTIEVTVDMKVPLGIDYEELAALFVRARYHCSSPEYHRRFSIFNHRAQRWLAMKRGTMASGEVNDELRIERIADYVESKTRQVRVRLYLEQTGDERFEAKFDHFVFSGKPQPRVAAHDRAKKAADVVVRQPNMRVHEADGPGSGRAQELVDQFKDY